jgi:hypothetical protein
MGAADERPVPAEGRNRPPPYTRHMRRWVCIIALLAGFSADGYVRGPRLREPVAVHRLIDERRSPGTGFAPTSAWWTRPAR